MSSPAATPVIARRGMWRWSVALVATAALVVSGSGLVVFAQSGDGQSQGPQFVPADASAYVEARLDMPAGQDAALAQMMTAFPGFADAGSFQLKMNELLSGLGAQMGVALPEGDLFGDVLTGEIGIALGDLEPMVMGGDPTLMVGLAMADAEAAGGVMEALLAQASDSVTQSSYNDVAIMTDTSSSPPMSVAMHDDWMLLASGEETMASVIDVLDGSAPSLADDADFTAAWSRLPSARLGAAWLDLSGFGSLLDLGAMMAEGQVGMTLPMPMDDLAAALPQDMVASLVAADDRLTLEVLLTPGEQTPTMPMGESDLAMSFPADTQIYIESRELGATVQGALNQVADLLAAQAAAMPDDGSMGTSGLGDIEVLFGEESPITALLGVPLPEFLDFVGDASIGAGLSSDGLWLGIAADVVDAAAADERITSLMTVLRMFTMQTEGEVTMETVDVGGVDVTTITLPLDAMLAESGLPLSAGDSIDVALTDDTLLIGLGDFVESALMSDGADSLGSSAGYIDALAGETVNGGVMYMDLGSLLAVLNPMLSMMAPEWTDLAPYAAGLDRMVVVNSADDESIRSRMTMIVGQ
jgi:hypothetical protein